MTNSPANSKSVPRRRVVQTAVWSTPVLALAVATPAGAASQTPPVVERRSGWSVGMGYTSLTTGGAWRSTSTINVSFGPNAANPALSLASNTPNLTAQATQFSQDLTTPFPVTWSSSAGWSIATVRNGPAQWIYRFTPDTTVLPTNSNIAVATPATNFTRNPATTANSIPQGTWTGTVSNAAAVSSGFVTNGRVVRGVAVNYPISVVRRYTVRYPAPWGNRAVIADGATSITVTPTD